MKEKRDSMELENGYVQSGDSLPEEEQEGKADGLTFGVTENPPIHITILYAFQVSVKFARVREASR